MKEEIKKRKSTQSYRNLSRRRCTSKKDYDIYYPVDSIFYRGQWGEWRKYNETHHLWLTDNILYACDYINRKKQNIIMLRNKKQLKLLNLYKVNTTGMRDKIVNIKGKNGNINISFIELYKIIFGIGYKKQPSIQNIQDIKDLKNGNRKYLDTQVGKIYELQSIFGRGEKSVINWLKHLIKKKNRKVIKGKNKFNRISTINLDVIFMNELYKLYPEYDGYYCRNLPSDWNYRKNDDGNEEYMLNSEIGLLKSIFKKDKILVHKEIGNASKKCKLLKRKRKTKKKSSKK